MRTPRRSLYLRTLAAALSAVALGEILVPCMALADIPAIAARQRAEKKNFTDSEIVEGFMKTAFGAEYHLAGRVDRIRKYAVPVRVFADGTRADRKAQIAKIVADIASRVKHLDIAINDNVSMGYFDVYDQYLLNLLYDPRIKAGMTVQEAKAVLPEVLADVRIWVKQVNGLAE